MTNIQSVNLFAALNAAQNFDFGWQANAAADYVEAAKVRVAGLDRESAAPIKAAAMIAESLASWHQDRAAGALRHDGPNKSAYQSLAFQHGDSLQFNRYVVDFHLKPEMFDSAMHAAVQSELEPLGITVRSISAAARYANDGPPEFRRMDRPATTTYCHIEAEISI